MSWKGSEERAYYQKYKRVKCENDQNWFRVFELPHNVYAICESEHFQVITSYLIMGKEKAILFDTGMGICNIKTLVEELYQGEIIVINSHFHFDHIGDNHRFEKVHVWLDEFVEKVAKEGLVKEEMGNQLDEDMFLYGYPEGFNPDTFKILPYTVEDIKNHTTFDLGGRVIKVYHTPGHSNDSVMLYDEDAKVLFTGDTFYLGPLYTHFDCNEFGKSNMNEYIASLEYVIEETKGVEYLYPSHDEFMANAEKLQAAADALKLISNHTDLEKKDMFKGHVYLEDGCLLNEYPFDGFSVIVKEEE